jgi:hypothetical protein
LYDLFPFGIVFHKHIASESSRNGILCAMNAKWSEPPWDKIDDHTTTQFYPSFNVWGQSFSPKPLTEQTGLAFTEANEVGEIGVTGPGQGQLSHYGAAILRPSETVFPSQSLFWMMENVTGRYTRKFREEHGITEEVLYLTVHFQGQRSLVLPSVLMKGLAGSFGIPLIITCIQPGNSPTHLLSGN